MSSFKATKTKDGKIRLRGPGLKMGQSGKVNIGDISPNGKPVKKQGTAREVWLGRAKWVETPSGHGTLTRDKIVRVSKGKTREGKKLYKYVSAGRYLNGVRAYARNDMNAPGDFSKKKK
jgi:hypothetical protein